MILERGPAGGQLCKNWNMKYLFSFLLLAYGCNVSSQKNKVTPGNIGGPCEGCEAIYEAPLPFNQLTHRTRLADADSPGIQLTVSGVVYLPGGAPAPGVIIYVYHTDQKGVYPLRGDEQGWARRHGYLRGWMKTNEKGAYSFTTLRPQPYPGRSGPAHIHVTIKEPDKNAYWIDEFVFDDDPLLDETHRNSMQNRGGSGILQIPPAEAGKQNLNLVRNIYLGRNIPRYPHPEKHTGRVQGFTDNLLFFRAFQW